MLITFQSRAWHDVTLFGDVAVTLLKLAGHSGTVPGAILAPDIGKAIAHLHLGLATARHEEAGGQSVSADGKKGDGSSPVSLALRAYPLIQLLSAAEQRECDVMWNAGAPPV